MEIQNGEMPARFPDTTDAMRDVIEGSDGQRTRPNRLLGDIVVSGISGRFPESDSIGEFKDNLFSGLDMVTDDERRWPAGLYGLPKRTGKLKDLSKFDSNFFGVHAKQADLMDPQLRLALETTFECLIDAGVNPDEMRGTNTGVFIGVSSSESGEFWTVDPEKINGYSLTGCARAMFPNRISFTFDFRGPSFAIDTACSSSLLAFHQAVTAIRSGTCDAAIVGGLNLLLKPTESLNFHRLSMLSPDGACKAFDSSGNGYVRSETVCTVFLQKAKDAKRIYSYVVNTGTNTDGNKQEGITFPSGKVQSELIDRVFKEVGLNPNEVNYVEAHGTGTKVGDPQEVNAVAEIFCKGRTSPLLIGSVKSNMGHSEPASGLCGLAKVLIAMESNKIPSNLHFFEPNKDIPALSDGRIQVVNKNWDWNGGFASINSFGFGGANVHLILRSNPKPKALPVKDNIPKLVCVTGRTRDAVDSYLKSIEQHPKDEDLVTLVHNIHKKAISGHSFRGYSVLGGESNIREISEELNKRHIWYVFSGMGSQWAGMGRAYMCLPPFSAAIHRCATALETEGVDLLNLIYHGVEETFDNVVNCFVSIAAIQVALVDLLTALGIKPDGIIGHSAGELGCAYADGSFTPEQTVLAAYWRGKSVIESKLEEGAMAAVALTWEEAKARVPPTIIAACHNGSDSVTVSGPVGDIDPFVAQLKAEGVFAKKVQSSGIAFHSKYIAAAAPKLRSNLERIIPAPKPRSKRWLSSSIPEAGWSSQLAALSSAAYHVNNLLSPVLFHEVVLRIPEDATVIEIAPHSLFQAVLKRSLPKSCLNIGLVKKGIPNELGCFTANIGKLYLAGISPDLKLFNRPSSFPVARGTPMIAPMIKWDHSTIWDVGNYKMAGGSGVGETKIEINTSTEKDSYITGHNIDGRVLFPATGYMTLVWKTFAKLHEKPMEETAVVMKNLNFLRATIMPKDGSIKFLVNIFDGNGNFEISEGGSTVVTGQILMSDGIAKDGLKLPNSPPAPIKKLRELNKDEIYRDFRLRGYGYTGIFQGLKKADNYGITGTLEWSDNWISFMDTLLQFSLIGMNTRELYVPTRILQATIDPQVHLQMLNGEEEISVNMYKNLNIVRSGGIELRGLKCNQVPKRTGIQNDPKLEQYRFIPYQVKNELAWENAMTVILQLVLENSGAVTKLNVTEACVNKIAPEALFAPDVVKVLESEPLTTVDMTVSSPNSELYTAIVNPINGKTQKKDINEEPVGNNLHLVVGAKLFSNGNLLKNALDSVKSGGFVLTLEDPKQNIAMNGNTFEIASKIPTEKGVLVLLRKVESWQMPEVIEVTHTEYNWIEPIKEAMKKSEKTGNKYLLVAQKHAETGIIGLFNCIKLEAGGENFRCLFLADGPSKGFNLAAQKDQLKKDLLVNVYKGGEWGSMRHLGIKTDESFLDVEHAYVNTLTKGDLSSLRWIEGPLSFARPEHYPHREQCTIYYAPLNFKDVMLATGKLPPDALPGKQSELECILGIEFAGRNSKGQRVFGTVEAQAMATSIYSDPLFLWPIPAKWTMEQASTIPTVYMTSYYALIIRGQMKRGESVLIHAGTGGVGQASINIALSMGCEIFTTVGSQEKRDFLKKNFPQLKDCNIGNSRDGSFEQMIMEQTNGRGVDVVLNSLAGDLLLASVRCLAENGRFLEIGKADLASNSSLGMGIFLKSIAFHGILLDAYFEEDANPTVKREISRLLSEGIEKGVVKPLPCTTFPHTQIEQSFRYMAAGKHIGKVVIKVKEEEHAKVVKDCKPQVIRAIPKTYMNPDKSYIILGGLGGFGLELAQWMLIRGARHIILVSSRGISSGYQDLCLRRWSERGYNVTVSTEDTTTMAGANNLLEQANKLAPVGGIFNLAVVLRDSLMENQTEEDYETVCKVKVNTTRNLDVASRNLCPQLDYFVVFSSISCGRGNAGQTNYGYANSVMERICESRQASSYPATAIQWGAIGDVGLVIDRMKGNNEMVIGGTYPQKMTSCMTTLDKFLQMSNPVLSSIVIAEMRKKSKGLNEIGLLDTVGNILGLRDVTNIPGSTSLSDLGMDSLMGSEIKQTLEREFDLVLSPAEIRSITFGKLRDLSSGTAKIDDTAQASEKIENELITFQADKLMPTEILVKMKSSDKKTDKPPLFFVHPIEGTVACLKTITECITSEDIWGVQCTADVPLDTIEKAVTHYIKEIRKVQPNGPYRIVGYSFGALLAYEMGIQLEQNYKEQVAITFVDGSPSFVSSHTFHYRQFRNEKADESDALAYFMSLFDSSVDLTKTHGDIKALPSLESKLNHCTSQLKPFLPGIPEKEISLAGLSFYNKLRGAEEYKVKEKFGGKTILIKAKDNFVGFDMVNNLKQICMQSVLVYTMEGTHRTILKGESGKNIAKIISDF